tara:strand:+ start:794 stop:1333 length:540 start_codon:yes stop_codon:yes gene_type:complete
VSKNHIRKKILKLRQKKNFKNQPFQIEKIFKFIKNINLKNKVIGCYYPISFEANIVELIKKLQLNNYQVGLPIIHKNFDMDFYEFKFNDPMYINNLGIPEPKKRGKIIPNILLMPLVAYDKNLNRIGYGGGYYDRYIKKMEKKKLIKIGLAFSCQKVNQIPFNKFDKKLDHIFTEKDSY